MPAPFVIAHMEVNRILEEAGAPLTDQQRAGVFLTNALTGWVPVQHPQSVMYPEMVEEREAAEEIKQHGAILVILGNPPYNGYAGIARIEEERNLTTAYRAPVAGLPAPQGQGLNDLYIRFFRIAERRIAANPDGQGIVSFISNNAWLDGLSHTTMRHHYLQTFQQLYIDNLNGDKYRTGKTTPEREPDPSAFSTPKNREGIQVGTAIATLVRNTAAAAPAAPLLSSFHTGGGSASRSLLPSHIPAVHLRDLWGAAKLSHLERESRREAEPTYTTLTPNAALGLPLARRIHSAAYTKWPRLPELFPISFPGIKTSRDALLVDIDRDRLEIRMKQYFDSRVADIDMSRSVPCSMESTARFNAAEVRRTLQARAFRPWQIMRYTYRPFDTRWLYWEPNTKLLDEKREEYIAGPLFQTAFVIAQKSRTGYKPPQVTTQPYDLNATDGGANVYRMSEFGDALLDQSVQLANLTMAAASYVRARTVIVGDLFFHALATMHTPAYRTENAGALLADWPRIPLPATADLLTHSAILGRHLADLLDPESDLQLTAEWTFLASLKLPRNPDLTRDLQLTAGWGARGQGSTVMPGRGRIAERPWTPAEMEKLRVLEASQSLTLQAALTLLGETCVDVYLNSPVPGSSGPDEPGVFWSAIPIHVWNYTLGGYQVLKKWLSYRELPLLGRPLHSEEAAYFAGVVRRITAILLLGPALDRSYAAILPTATGLPSTPSRSTPDGTKPLIPPI